MRNDYELSSPHRIIRLVPNYISLHNTMTSPLSALSNILSSGIATIESAYAKNGATFPSLDEPFKPPPFAEDALLSQTIDHVISAAAQLIMTVKPPQRTLVESSLSVSDPSCR